MTTRRVISGSTNQYEEIGRIIETYTNDGYRVVALSQSQNGFTTIWICALERER